MALIDEGTKTKLRELWLVESVLQLAEQGTA